MPHLSGYILVIKIHQLQKQASLGVFYHDLLSLRYYHNERFIEALVQCYSTGGGKLSFDPGQSAHAHNCSMQLLLPVAFCLFPPHQHKDGQPRAASGKPESSAPCVLLLGWHNLCYDNELWCFFPSTLTCFTLMKTMTFFLLLWGDLPILCFNISIC